MKQLLLLVALATIAQTAAANNYYFSVTGDDSRTEVQARNPATPWKSLSKLNAIFNNLRAGDSVLLKRGDIFYGQLYLSGYSTDAIVISAYGIGPKPVISGFTQVSGWTSFGGNRYEASLPEGKSAVNMVTVNGGVRAMGRYPNATAANGGYLTFTSHNGTSSITSPAVNASGSWIGAQVVIRKTRWIIDRGLVTAQTGNTIYYKTPTSIEPEDQFGFFFQNSYNTLDADGEWYYNATNKKFDLYSDTHPSNRVVKVATIDTLVFMYAKDHVTIEDISFEGSNVQTFQINNCNYNTIRDCEINFSGLNAVNLFATTYTTFAGNVISNTNNNSLYAITENSKITGSTIRNTGLWPGMGKDDNQARLGLLAAGNNNLIQYNRMDSLGYIGIYMYGNNALVLNNYISNFCLTTDDGGGIYSSGEPNATGRIIRGNIVMNGRGNRYGTNQAEDLAASGIYADDRSSGELIDDNTIANCSENGVMLHNAHEIHVKNNIIYNVRRQITMAHDGIAPYDPIRNIWMQGNVFAALSSTQLSMALYSRVSDIEQFGMIDSNRYYRNETGTFFQCVTNTESNYTHKNYSLEEVNTIFGANRNSTEKLIDTHDQALRLEFNETSAPKVIPLGGTYTDLATDRSMTQLNLAPYNSVLLLKTANTPAVVRNKRPVADAGRDQVTTGSTVSLSGSGSKDSDGKIVSYSWTKILGPNQFNIVSPNNMNVAPKNLVAGVYVFRLKVIDNLGGIALDTVQVTVAPLKANSSLATVHAEAEPVAKNATGLHTMSVYPNPAAHMINIRCSANQAGPVRMSIYDATGRMIQSRKESISAGSLTRSVNVRALGKGAYYAELRFANGEKLSLPFMKN